MQIVKNINGKSERNEKLTVILAEEHLFTAKLERKGLEDGGFVVHVAQSRAEIIELVKGHKIDVLMMDIHFKKQKNLDYLQKLKANSKNPNIKIVLTSVVPVKGIVDKKIKENVDLFLVKPISRTKVIEKIKKITQQSVRGLDRAHVNFPVVIAFNEHEYHLNVLDISASGIHVQDKKHALSLEVDHSVDIELKLPTYKVPISCKGRIVRFTKEGAGIKITRISKESKLKIEKTLEKISLDHKAQIYYL